MNKNEVNKKVEDTLNSIENLKKAQPNEFIFNRIMNRINEGEPVHSKENSYFGKFAVGFAVLAVINVFSLLSYEKAEEKSTVYNSQQNLTNNSITIKEFAKEYFADPDQYNYGK